ncbi:MAG TPA: hypothetical protein VE860_14790 [Chthoniobacterales bacterium]|jgi:hypothetical protein|nr:hypothetical protein [Chthoniobacterales bacterium]
MNTITRAHRSVSDIDTRTLQRLVLATFSAGVSYFAALFMTILRLPIQWRFVLLVPCVLAFIGSVAFLSLASQSHSR